MAKNISIGAAVANLARLHTRANKDGGAAVKLLSKESVLKGESRVFTPTDDEGETRPATSVKVQHNSKDLLATLSKVLGDFFNYELTKNLGNCMNTATVTVSGLSLELDMSSLLFLRTQLTELAGKFNSFSTLSNQSEWLMDEDTGFRRTPPVVTVSYKNVETPLLLAPATKEHPAQVKTFQQQVEQGRWSATQFSSQLSPTEVEAMKRRTEELLMLLNVAIKDINANKVEVDNNGSQLVNYIING
jgi:hypothetical protein